MAKFRNMAPDELPDAYPLSWPDGVARTPPEQRTRARFGKRRTETHIRSDGTSWSYSQKGKVTIAEGIRRILEQVDLHGGTYPVISSNVALRQDGLPRSGQREPDDVGVALYFFREGETVCIPNDRYDRVADCMAAIAGHLDAMRSMLRWGCGTGSQAFSGYRAQLPAPGVDWRSTFATMTGTVPRTPQEAKELHRRAFADQHPDRPGGMSQAQASRLNEARSAAIEALESRK